MQIKSQSRCLFWTAAALLAVSCQAQVMQAPGTMPGRRLPLPTKRESQDAPGPPRPSTPQSVPTTPQAKPTGAAAPAANTAPNAAPNAAATQPAAALKAPSLADKPAVPAQVTLHDGSLSVDARNSSLSDILKHVEATSGMTVDGFDKDSRVFGVYGPASPREVLSELLDGAGYNFLMVGTGSDGTPREIVLTARSNAPVSAPSPGGGSQQEEEEEPSFPQPQQVEPPQPQPPVNQPPEQRPRTPQEMLQELQRLRQQQQQQQQNQPQ